MFAPVRSQTAFEETVERLGTAIKLGLLPPGTRLPAERELCAKLGIARSTLRQALVALGQSGHLHATRGRGGGTFVADPQPPARRPRQRAAARTGARCATSAWRSRSGSRCSPPSGPSPRRSTRSTSWWTRSTAMLEDFPAYRQADIRFHVGLAEATGSPRLVAAMTEAQGAMTDLISLIAHPPEVLDSSNDQHRRLLARRAPRATTMRAAREMTEHLRGHRARPRRAAARRLSARAAWDVDFAGCA